jgi:hypothetical protein
MVDERARGLESLRVDELEVIDLTLTGKHIHRFRNYDAR